MTELVRFHPWEQVSGPAQRAFERHAARIRAALPDAMVEHVGSTAVPGSITKGDVDLQVRIPAVRFAAAEAAIGGLYARNAGSTRTEDFAAFEEKGDLDVGVQLTAVGSPFDFFVELRDRLRRDAASFEAYQALKAAHEGAPMSAWRAAKESFFQALLASERASRGRLEGAARAAARERAVFMEAFLAQLGREL